MRTAPSFSHSYDALCLFYNTQRFCWTYEDLFSRLMECPRQCAFVTSASRVMRDEHPRFQYSRNVLMPHGPILAAVADQANAVVAACERGIREGWDLGHGHSLRSGQARRIRLMWSGPFSFSEMGDFPSVFGQREASSPGIYAWTVPLDDAHLVAYVGKTDRSFSIRLAEEVDYHLSGKDGFWDVELYTQGIRRRISPPPGDAEAHLQEILARCAVFLAPLIETPTVLEQIETGLIRHLRAAGHRCEQFLSNRRCPFVQGAPLEVEVASSVKLIGLGDRVYA